MKQKEITSQNYIIQTSGLCKSSGSHHRVKNVNLQIPPNCVYGFLGPNGAGKSTTLKMILGLITPSSGAVYLMNEKMSAHNRLSLLRNTGSLIENPSYYGHLTGFENMELVARLKGCKRKEIDEVLQLVRLENAQDKKTKHYSLGMKQRLGIAMALLGKPRILILDEPTNGLDPAGIQEIRNLIRSLPTRYNMTVLISSHLLHEIEQIADLVGIIHHGELIFQGSLDALKATDSNAEHKDLEEIFLQLTGGAESL